MAQFDGNVVIGTTVDMYGINEGLAKIQKSFKKLNFSGLTNLNKSVKKLNTSFSNNAVGYFIQNISKISSLASPLTMINKFTTAFSRLNKVIVATAIVAGLFKIGSAAIDAASNLAEVQNVVDVSFGDMAYKANNFAKIATQAYGMSELAAKKTAGAFMSMGKAMDLTDEQASNMAINLTALSGDMASFLNISQDYAQIALSAVYTGETETLKKYGIVLTEANLQQYALSKGIETSVKKMDAQSKALLRYSYVVEQTAHMQHDFIRTQDTWANQTRLLREQWTQFLTILGTGLSKILTPMLKVLNQLLASIIRWANVLGAVIGRLLGIEWTDMSSPVLDLSNASESASDNINDLDKNQKKLADDTKKATNELKKQLQGYDELNNITSDTNKDNGDDDLTINLGSPKLDDVLGDLSSKVEGGFGDIKDGIIDQIKSWFDLGRYIADSLEAALDSIDWDIIYQHARNFASGLADFLNGLFSPSLFYEVGQTIASCLNTALHFLDQFGYDFDFSNFGTSIAQGMNGFMAHIDWNTALSAAGNWGKGIADAINSWVSDYNWALAGYTAAMNLNTWIHAMATYAATMDWGELGRGLGIGITTYFNTINYDELLQGARDWGSGLATTLSKFLQYTDWTSVGNGIAQGINTAISLVGSFLQTLNWEELGTSISELIRGFLTNVNWADLADGFDALVQGLATTLKSFIDDGVKNGTFSAVFDSLKELLSHIDIETVEIIIKALVLKQIGSAILNGIKLKLAEQLIPYIKESIELAWLTAQVGLKLKVGSLEASIRTALAGMGPKIASGFASAFTGIQTFFTVTLPGWFASISSTLSPIISAIAPIALIVGGIATTVGGIVNGLQNGWNWVSQILIIIGSILTTIGLIVAGVASLPAIIIGGIIAAVSTLIVIIHDNWDAICEWASNLGSWINENIIQPVVEWAGKLWEDVKLIFAGVGEFFSGLWDNIKEVFAPVTEFFQEIWDSIVSIFNGAYEFVSGIIEPIVNFISGFVTRIIQFFQGCWIIIKAIFIVVTSWVNDNIITPVTEAISDFIDGVKEFFQGLWDKIVEIFTSVVSWVDENIITPVTKAVSDFVDDVKETFSKLWDKIVEIFTGAYEWVSKNIIEPISEGISDFVDAVKKFFTDLWDNIVKIFSDVWDWVNTNILEPIQKGVTDFCDAVVGFFSDLWDDIVGVFSDAWNWFDTNVITPISDAFNTLCEDIGGFFSDLWDNITRGVRNAFNTVIDVIEGALNGIISGINWFIDGFNSVVNWAAGITGDNWSGIDKISEVNLPRLAQGAVIPPNSEFMAILGDQKSGTNVEAPLATIQEAMFNALMQAGLVGNSSNNQDIVVELDGREIARAVRREDNVFKKSTGSSMFAY